MLSSSLGRLDNIPRVALDRTRPVSIANVRALESEMARICEKLSTAEDAGRDLEGMHSGGRDRDGQASWDARMDAMRRLNGIAQGGAAEKFQKAFAAGAKRLRGPLEEQWVLFSSLLFSSTTRAPGALGLDISLSL